MIRIDYQKTAKLLKERFAKAEAEYMKGQAPTVEQGIVDAYDSLFSSNTQAYREGLLGCVVARIQDREINIRLPYTKHGPKAYNGRTLDERVINPFLVSKKVPCSRAPFLSTLRRGVKFVPDMSIGVRDKKGFDAFLHVIEALEHREEEADLFAILDYHLFRFIELRESSNVPISRMSRISLVQCDTLITGLLNVPSGGRFPMFLVVAAFRSIEAVFDLDWEVEFQGINVADQASGARGDVTIKYKGKLFFAAEVTERSVDEQRVVSTFDTKIAPNEIADYLFFVKNRDQATEAIEHAKKYFSQGHEVNFVEIKEWILAMLSTLGQHGRRVFLDEMTGFLDTVEIPQTLKISWNNTIQKIASGG